MKILHISVSDKIGGAAIAASRLNTAMIMAGWNSKLLVLYKRSIDDDVVLHCTGSGKQIVFP